MTNLQALQSIIGFNSNLPALLFEKALIDAGLSEMDIYSADNEMKIDICAAGLILVIVTAPDIKEGGYELTAGDRKDLLEVRGLLLGKYGLNTGTAQINNVSNRW